MRRFICLVASVKNEYNTDRGEKMQKKIDLGGRELIYEFSRKRVKNLNLRIRGDGSVTVSAPLRMPMEQVEEFLRRKQDFVWRAIEKAEMGKGMRVGENNVIPYLGGTMRLRFEEGRRYAARRMGDELCLTLPNAGEESCRQAALERWEKEESARVMGEILESLYPAFAPYGVPKPTLRFRAMKSRWGSCIPSKGIVTLNTRLLAYSADCIEYILIHELCHFLQADHSVKFYAWMDRFLPNWREIRKKLKESK